MRHKYGKGVKARYGIRPKKTAAQRRKEGDDEKRFFQFEKKLELARKRKFKSMKIAKEALGGGSSSSHNMNLSSDYVVDYDCDYEDDHEEVHETTFTGQAKKKRKECWRENSRVLENSFLESFELNGHPNEHLTSLDDSKLPTCDCIKSSIELTVFTLFDQFIEKIEYCSVYRLLLQTSILLKVVPSATDSPNWRVDLRVIFDNQEDQQQKDYDLMQIEATRISPTRQKLDFDHVKLLVETKDILDSIEELTNNCLYCIQFCGLELYKYKLTYGFDTLYISSRVDHQFLPLTLRHSFNH
ncbi:hypothetical protein [Parasitella parasitica]|uniref:Uncharacterized protein n=1 Tax=Parasitella parasitica TaxID=35722 RepID=A0A0B7NXL9_9FUNG|nr:hypothetical protein [Parasitella parasitica]